MYKDNLVEPSTASTTQSWRIRGRSQVRYIRARYEAGEARTQGMIRQIVDVVQMTLQCVVSRILGAAYHAVPFASAQTLHLIGPSVVSSGVVAMTAGARERRDVVLLLAFVDERRRLNL